MPEAPTVPSALRRPSGLQHLDRPEFRRWALAAIGVTAVGYAAVFLANVTLNTDRPYTYVTQAATVVVSVVALWMAYGDRLETAAAITMLAVWVELHSTIPFDGLEASALVVFPALVVAAGVTIGGRGALWMAVASAVTLSLVTFLSHAIWGVPAENVGWEVYLLLVTTASMLVVAAFTTAGVQAFGRVASAARRSEARLADLIRHAPDGIVVLGLRGGIVSVNPAAARLLGQSEEELVGRPMSTVLGELTLPEHHGTVARILEGGDRAPTLLQLRLPTGARTWLEVSVARMPPDSGEAALQLTLRDVTQRVAAEESEALLRTQLEHAQRLEAVGRLAGGVAHDFNNLLTVVGGSAELLMSETEGETRKLAEEILVAKQRGTTLTQGLLAFARKEMIQPELLEAAEVLVEMRPLVERLLGEGVTLHYAAEDAPPIWGDRAQLEQVVVNLLANARDATEAAGSVRLGSSSPDAPRAWKGGELTPCPEGFVEIWIEDDGVGMDTGTLDRIFEPFFTTKPRGQGTGLGLATVHGILSQHQGNVQVVSEPGVGTVARLFWPVRDSA